MGRNVPLRKSLLARLLVTSMLIALCSIVATAWLAVQTTTRAIQQEQGQILSDDAMIHDTLTGYAAGHRAWSGVRPTIERLARVTGRRVALTDQERHVLADSAPEGPGLPPRAFAVIDALRTDTPLQGQSATQAASRIDPRAVGPYLLPAAERAELALVAGKVLACLRDEGWVGKVVDGPSGRPTVQVAREGRTTPDAYGFDDCGLVEMTRPTATERRALSGLDTLVNACLTRQGSVIAGYVALSADFTWEKGRKAAPDFQVLQECIDASRREQLRTFVAPAAQLFVSDTAASSPRFDLSRANTTRIAGVTGLVLLLTVIVTALIATRLVRPLRALTDAAQEPTERHTRVPVTTSDETGFLAKAFNDLSERRERTETQRKAMVSDIAHELRTPLTNIRGWLEVAKDGIVVPDQRLLSSLHDEALLLQHIIDDLQDLASADAGTLRLHPEPVRLRDLLHQVADANLAHAQVAGVRIECEVRGDPQLSADPVRLRQALGNLVSNALRHTPSGGTVRLHAHGSGEMVVIEVADTGSGIAPEDLPNVFDRFWRAERSRSRRTGGSGLGLAIVRQLAQAHGGTVSARSVLGESTVFTLRLPARPATEAPDGTATGPASAGRVPGDAAEPRGRFRGNRPRDRHRGH
ncbi:HAMP domain-containing sensor histidine kinase [Streptomyces sp. SPB162]|uniref:sensor histidine kinase n=1 Tax=Streptomyces sp. SPB162 TaxID=2940560 RepID=UPI0024064DB7|nr:HAMP domain-containing sensor histidine kinase [Streptomyces sp. SPB162]MDF9811147.1 two-component system sensor histidine kinase BaeS [Streptomyces sp. SPB162]